MDERRLQTRHTAVFQAEIIDVGSGSLVGHLADISTGGLMIRAGESLAPGRSLKLRLELPARQADGVEARVEAEVCWCEPDLTPHTFVVGLQFAGATPPEGALVNELVRVLKDAG